MVAVYASVLRGLDESPERLISNAKEMAYEATEAATATIARTNWIRAGLLRDRLRDDVVRWAIDGYYGLM